MSELAKIPVELEFDFVVAGGGLAGICCAIAAARKGAKTALVQDRPVLGGNSSSEIRVTPAGSVNFHSWSMEGGIVEEFLLEDRANNPTDFGDGATNSLYDICLYRKALKEENLQVFLNTSIRGVDVEKAADGSLKILSIQGSQLGTGKEFHFLAKSFADCTGDSFVGALAGAESRYGRDARSEFGENLAPLIADDHTMGSSINFYARNVGKPVPFVPPDWAKKYRSAEEIGLRRDIHVRPDRVCGFWWMELSKPFHQVADSEQIKHELLSHILGVWDYYKNYSERREELSTYSIEWIGSVPGKRESRRLMGDVILTEGDLQNATLWPDAVCTSGGFIDIHINGGILNKTEPPELSNTDLNYGAYTNVPLYTIPLRALYSRNVRNLWMAGRNISSSRVALGSYRVQITLGNMGQAVGTSAAYAIRENLLPREVAEPSSHHIRTIQRELLADDIHIIGLPYDDSANLAAGAAVEASSEQSLALNEPDLGKWVKLDKEWGQVIPLTADTLDSVELYLENRTSEPARLRVTISELDTIWDKSQGSAIAETEVSLEPKFTGWVAVPIGVSVNSGLPHRIALKTEDEVFWARNAHQATGTLAQHRYTCSGGCDQKNLTYPSFRENELIVPAFDKWNESKRNFFSFAICVTPESRPYGAQAAAGTHNRPWRMPNLWISSEDRPLPQKLTLALKRKERLNRVVVFFDTDLNSLHALNPGLWKAPECARDWQLHCWKDNRWQLLFEETENFQRHRIIDFPPIDTDRVQLTVTATNGSKQARVYNVRLYHVPASGLV